MAVVVDLLLPPPPPSPSRSAAARPPRVAPTAAVAALPCPAGRLMPSVRSARNPARDTVRGRGSRELATAAAPPAAAAPAMDGELAVQLAAMAERLDALEATVSVKDQEIARLEAALREARDSAEAAAADAAAARARAAAPAPAQAASSSGGFMPWIYGIAGAVVLGLLAVLGLRRARGGAAPAPAEAARPQGPAAASAAAPADNDVFAGVTLREDGIDDSADAEEAPEPEEPARRDVAERGYGERRYDDYIDDADGGDALAEADIYIAYGRYLQAAELLNTAIRAEPGNSAFRLKLIELYTDMGEGAKAAQEAVASAACDFE